MKKRPNAFAAVAATVVLLLALSPFFIGAVIASTHWNGSAEWAVLLFWLGAPGIWVADAIAGNDRRASLAIALFATWAFYFGVFRLIAGWRGFRKWMRHKAEDYVSRQKRKKLSGG